MFTMRSLAWILSLIVPQSLAWFTTHPYLVRVRHGGKVRTETMAWGPMQSRYCDRSRPSLDSVALYRDENDDDENDDIDERDNSLDRVDSMENDWFQTELFLQTIPIEPSPDMSAEMVARIIVHSLQLVDYPSPRAGLERCYPFLTYDCRKAVTGRQGGASVERFVQYGAQSPALQPFMGAKSIALGGVDTETPTYTPARPPFRGALVSFPIVIVGSDLWSLQYPQSGLTRSGIAAQSVTRMVLRLEQQRQPPSCWLCKEILDVRYAFAGDMGNDMPE